MATCMMVGLDQNEWWYVQPNTPVAFDPVTRHGAVLHRKSLYIAGGLCVPPPQPVEASNDGKRNQQQPRQHYGGLRGINLSAKELTWQDPVELDISDKSQYDRCALISYADKIFLFGGKQTKLGSPHFVNASSKDKPVGRLACRGPTPSHKYFQVRPFRLTSIAGAGAQDVLFLICWRALPEGAEGLDREFDA